MMMMIEEIRRDMKENDNNINTNSSDTAAHTHNSFGAMWLLFVWSFSCLSFTRGLLLHTRHYN